MIRALSGADRSWVHALRQSKPGQPQRLAIERRSEGATGAVSKHADQRIGERTATFLQRDHRGEHLLLILHNQFRGLQQALDDAA